MAIEFWYDVETTGLKIKDGAAVVQFAGMIVEEGVIKHTFNEKINPFSYNRPTTIDPKALEINGFKESEFDSFRTLTEVLGEIMDYLAKNYGKSKLTLVGYNNSTFDKYFIEDMFEDQGKKFWLYFNWKQIDVFELIKALQFMGFMGTTFNQKLGTIGEYLQIPLEGELHDALVDVKLTRGIYLKIQEKLNASN